MKLEMIDDIAVYQFSEEDLNNQREPFDPTKYGPFCAFVQAVLRTDDDSYRTLPRLAANYYDRSAEFRAGIDEAFSVLCGWNFSTILHAAKTGKSLDDAMYREKSPEDLAAHKAQWPEITTS
jgi:hypothetical protein